MNEEMFEGDEPIEKVYNLWDLDEETQERIKEEMREADLDKLMDIDKAFILGEEEENEVLNKVELPKAIETGGLSKKIKYSDTIEHIHLSKLTEIDESINFFPLPGNEELLNLMGNIEQFGILTPLLVSKIGETDQYTVVCGRSRIAALNHLYNETQDEKYLYAPCLVLDSDTDQSILQGVVIATNLSYKKVSKNIQIKAVLLLDNILTNSKTYRTQMNVTNVVANKAGISRTTANTLRGFKNLSKKALDLLYEDHLTRGAARILSMIEDKEVQDKIIGELGNQINDIPKLREMLAESWKNEMVPDSLEMKLENTLDKVPRTTNITLQVDCEEVEDVLKTLIPLMGKAISKHQTFKDGDINKYFKVTLNENHMEQYVRKGFVTQGTIDLVRSGDYKEVIKYA
jgi:hypothetical protein